MKRIATVVAAALAFAGLQAAASAAGGYENYIVRPGDTLGGIAGRVLGDRGRWREILRENPQVKNPNLIYPGDTLRIAVPETASAAGAAAGLEARPGTGAAEAEAAAAAAAAAAEQEAAERAAAAAAAAKAAADAEAASAAAQAEPPLPVEVVRAVDLVNPGLYRAAGYIADGLPVVAILASVDGRLALGPGDEAIANAPTDPGTRFAVVRADRRIFHPVTRQPLGWLVRVIGTAETTCRGETTSTVAMRSLRDAATPGDYLAPWTPEEEAPVLSPKGAPRCVAPGAPDAMIVAFDEDRLSGSEQELVYIDRGTATGVEPGARFQIYRPVAPAGSVMVGEVQVLKAGPETATALVTNSLREVHIADRLRVE